LARRGPDVTREIRVEFDSNVAREFADESEDDANRNTEQALELVVQFLQREAGVPHFGFLPYRYLLVVLTRYFAHHHDPKPRNRDLLRRWFWRAAIIGPTLTRGSYTSTMRLLASCVEPGNDGRSVQRLLDTLPQRLPRFDLPRRFKSTHAESRFALCALWALAPRSTLTALPYEPADLSKSLAGRSTASDALEVVVARPPPDQRNRTSNRVILLGDDTIEVARERFGQRTLDLNEDDYRKMLESHALDSSLAHLLSSGDSAAFLSARHELMQRVTRDFLARMTESEFEDTPPLEDLDLDDFQADEEDGEPQTHAIS
jgi:hypothetical protein